MNVRKAVAVVGNQQRGHPDSEATMRDLAGYKMKHSHMPCARAPSIDKRGKIGFALGPGAQPQRPFSTFSPWVF